MAAEYIKREDALYFEMEIEADPEDIQAITKGMALYGEYIKSIPAADVVEREINRGYRCYMCGAKLKWESDANFEDAGMDGHGVISYYTCPGCSAWYEIFVPIDMEEEK